MGVIWRWGWRQLYQPKDTESDSEHIADIRDILIDLAAALHWRADKLGYAFFVDEVHEMEEEIDGGDQPTIPTDEMPRTKLGRIHHMNHVWIPPNRESAVENLAQTYSEQHDKISEWIQKNVPEEDWEIWEDAVRDFHLLETDVGQVVFEAHAFQPAERAVQRVIEVINDGKPHIFPVEAAMPFIAKAEKVLTIRHLVKRLDDLKQILERLRQEGKSLTRS